MASDLQADQSDRKASLVLIGLSLVLFVASLPLLACHYDGDHLEPTQQMAGWFAFVMGWIPACWNVLSLPHGDFEFLTTIAWFANPLLAGCWLVAAVGPRRVGIALGAAAFGLSLVFLFCHDIHMGTNHLTRVVPGLGCAAWVASMATALLGAALAANAGSRSSPEQDDASGDQSEASAVREALEQFRQGMSVSAKCPACRKRLMAKRTLSATSPVPDIEIACPCGACSEKHPFRPLVDRRPDGNTRTV